MVGGPGKDTYRFNNPKAFNRSSDWIIGFNPDKDKVDLQSIFAKSAFAKVATSKRFQRFVQLVQVGQHSKIRIDADDAGDNARFTTLASLQNVTVSALHSSNFIVV